VHAANDLTELTQLRRAFGIAAQSMPALSGTVVPARTGDTVTIQLRAGKGWRTVASTQLAAGGVYSVRVPRGGTYRTVYRGLDGPSVDVR
jgi:hypothetical protein